ncbi:MAG: CpsD/CapB family tyrosine-protein kinase, partial [Clostridia bacterium]|nr:CpsD/CapB family tyrosine-protein kinase [Clostridia bacterium]
MAKSNKYSYDRYSKYSSYGGYNSVDASMKFQVTESYKALRANMLLSVIKKGSKSFTITSACPSEGKSTISANIAISIAQTNAKVLLIDTDLRRPMVGKFMDFNNAPGLADILGGMAEIDDVLHETKYENLYVICAGVNVPNPAEMLGSTEMKELMKEFEERFDYVIVDSPPINTVSDALSLIKITNGVILVVREGQSTYTEVDKALKTLEFIDAKILGLVLNGVQSGTKRGYRYKYKYKSG